MLTKDDLFGLKTQIIFGYIASTIFWNFYTEFYKLILSPLVDKYLDFESYEKKGKKIEGYKFLGEVIKTAIALAIIYFAFKY